ncbi:MAG TPA: hypothetical protein VI819_02655 [Patescibacteria group bacterium]|nr:hypothetical protein [Patescibacteria group bacterium]
MTNTQQPSLLFLILSTDNIKKSQKEFNRKVKCREKAIRLMQILHKSLKSGAIWYLTGDLVVVFEHGD